MSKKHSIISTMNRIMRSVENVDKFMLNHRDYVKFQKESREIINVRKRGQLNSYCGVPIDFFSLPKDKESSYYSYSIEYNMN